MGICLHPSRHFPTTRSVRALLQVLLPPWARVWPGWGEERVFSPWDLCSISPALTPGPDIIYVCCHGQLQPSQQASRTNSKGRKRAALFIKHTSLSLSLSLHSVIFQLHAPNAQHCINWRTLTHSVLLYSDLYSLNSFFFFFNLAT